MRGHAGEVVVQPSTWSALDPGSSTYAFSFRRLQVDPLVLPDSRSRAPLQWSWTVTGSPQRGFFNMEGDSSGGSESWRIEAFSRDTEMRYEGSFGHGAKREWINATIDFG